MANLKLSMCLSDNPRTRPLREGRVRADGVDLVVSTVHPSEMFWRQLHFSEFDISEMSCSSLLMAIAGGDTRWVGIPVFTSRRFFHTGIMVRADAGIDRPEDLRDKRVGVPEYQQTAALWCRAVLQHEFGLTAFDLDWYMERTEALSHGSATRFTPSERLRFQRIPEKENIGSMLVAGRIDASLFYLNEANLVDRSTVDLESRPEIRPLFPDPVGEGVRYYRKTGFYPMNHCVVFRRDVVESNPWAVLNVFKAFNEGKNLVHRQILESAGAYFDLDLIPHDRRGAMDFDPYPYGVKSNRSALEALARYSHEQGLTPRILDLEEVFYAPTLDL